jgi:hypothetical protein
MPTTPTPTVVPSTPATGYTRPSGTVVLHHPGGGTVVTTRSRQFIGLRGTHAGGTHHAVWWVAATTDHEARSQPLRRLPDTTRLTLRQWPTGAWACAVCLQRQPDGTYREVAREAVTNL